MSESLRIRKWVPSPSEIFIDSLPLGKAPPKQSEKGEYLCAISFTVKEFVGMPRKIQIEVIEKVLETLEMVAKMQRAKFTECNAKRFNDNNGHGIMCFYAYFPKKSPEF